LSSRELENKAEATRDEKGENKKARIVIAVKEIG